MKTFEKFQKMADENSDIRLAPMSNIINIQIKGQKGEVTFGVDRQTAQDLIDNKEFVGGFLLADKKLFDLL